MPWERPKKWQKKKKKCILPFSNSAHCCQAHHRTASIIALPCSRIYYGNKKRTHDDCHCTVCQLKSAPWHPKIPDPGSSYGTVLPLWTIQHGSPKNQFLLVLIQTLPPAPFVFIVTLYVLLPLLVYTPKSSPLSFLLPRVY